MGGRTLVGCTVSLNIPAVPAGEGIKNSKYLTGTLPHMLMHLNQSRHQPCDSAREETELRVGACSRTPKLGEDKLAGWQAGTPKPPLGLSLCLGKGG